MFRKFAIRLLVFLIVVGAALYAWSLASPWPAALVIRHAFEWDAARTARALEKHVPPGVLVARDIRYGEARDALLDIYRPAQADPRRPTIVWVHGGAWISGGKADVGNYLQVLAGRGYAGVAIGYSIAPAATYPTPIRQVNAALGFLAREADRLGVNGGFLVLAGDSAGAQIVAQVANITTAPAYAAAVGVSPEIGPHQLGGVILYCGAYDLGAEGTNRAFAGFTRTVLWSYSGARDFRADPKFALASVAEHVTPAFAPTFISAGNGDPLLPQSILFADRLSSQGVPVDTLFFPAGRTPPLPHEYQFNLDTDAGREALERSLAFLDRLAAARD